MCKEAENNVIFTTQRDNVSLSRSLSTLSLSALSLSRANTIF